MLIDIDIPSRKGIFKCDSCGDKFEDHIIKRHDPKHICNSCKHKVQHAEENIKKIKEKAYKERLGFLADIEVGKIKYNMPSVVRPPMKEENKYLEDGGKDVDNSINKELGLDDDT